jgi:hypothetical protein
VVNTILAVPVSTVQVTNILLPVQPPVQLALAVRFLLVPNVVAHPVTLALTPLLLLLLAQTALVERFLQRELLRAPLARWQLNMLQLVLPRVQLARAVLRLRLTNARALLA